MPQLNLTDTLVELLQFHSILQKPEDFHPKNQKDIIKTFQSKFSLPVNGELNADTLWALQESFVLQSEPLDIIDVEVDQIPDKRALNTVKFRQDAAARFIKLQNEIKEKGGLVSCSAGIREIKMVAGAGQSPTSMHYPGLAFDLNIYAGFFEPETDLYVMTKVPTPSKSRPNRFYWNVYCRSEMGEEMELEVYYWDNEKSGVDQTKIITGKFINFTEIAKSHGFHPIPPQSCFTRTENRLYICCEWWHFQPNDLLIPKFSQFGIELMKVQTYTPEFLQKVSPNLWNARKAIYFQDWW